MEPQSSAQRSQKMRYSRIFWIAALLLASSHAVKQPWTFHITSQFNSSVSLVDSTVNIPMVFNEETNQLLRMIPANGINSSTNLNTAYSNMNLLQIFTPDLKRIKEVSIGPPSCGITWMGEFYTTEASSDSDCSSFSSTNPSSSRGSSCSRRVPCRCKPKYGSSTCPSKPSSNASAQKISYLGVSCPNKVALITYPLLKKHCSLFTEQAILKAITTTYGQTFILYSDHLIVIGSNCAILRGIDKFLYASIEWAAQDMVLDERTQSLAIGFNNFYYAVFDTKNLTIFFSKYMLGSAQSAPYKFFPSAMYFRETFYFRFVFNGETYYSWNCLYGCSDKPVPATAGAVRDNAALLTTCSPSSALASYITDYRNRADILISPVIGNLTLQIYVSQANNYTTIDKQCSWLSCPELTPSDNVVFNTNTNGSFRKRKNSFYLSFAPSLKILRIKYDTD